MQFFFALLFFQTSPLDQVYRPDELTIEHFFRSCRNGDYLIFGFGKGMSFKTAVYNLEKDEVRVIADGRRKAVGGSILVNTEGGFANIAHMGYPPLMDLFSLTGDYESTRKLNQISGWMPSFRIKTGVPWGKNRVMVTLIGDEEGLHLLGLLQLDREELEILHQARFHDDYKHFWVPMGDKVLEMVSETGQIDILDPADFQTKKNLRPKIEPVRRKASSTLARRQPIYSLIVQTAELEDRVLVYWAQPRDDASADPAFDMKIMEVSHSGWKYVDHWVLAFFGERCLIFDFEEKELRWIPLAEHNSSN